MDSSCDLGRGLVSDHARASEIEPSVRPRQALRSSAPANPFGPPLTCVTAVAAVALRCREPEPLPDGRRGLRNRSLCVGDRRAESSGFSDAYGRPPPCGHGRRHVIPARAGAGKPRRGDVGQLVTPATVVCDPAVVGGLSGRIIGGQIACREPVMRLGGVARSQSRRSARSSLRILRSSASVMCTAASSAAARWIAIRSGSPATR